MRRIINSTNVSLDGLIDKMELWHFEYVDDELEAIIAEDLAGCGALLMGRLTMRDSPVSGPTERATPTADKLNAMTKHVASTTLENPVEQHQRDPGGPGRVRYQAEAGAG